MYLSKITRGPIFFASGQVLCQIIGLLRNSVIGHSISPEDYGKAAVFALVVSLVESLSDLSADKLVMQYKYGSNHRVVGNIHFFNLVKGFFSFVILLLMYPVMMFFFDLGEASWGLILITIIPLIKSVANFDFIIEQKNLEYSKIIKVDLGGQLLALATVVIFLQLKKDYTPALYALIVQSISYSLISHLVSDNKFYFKFNYSLMYKLLNFGWPLLINGLAVFIILQGDKFIVSKFFDMEILGYYSALGALVFIPVVILTKVQMNILLPVYSSNKYINIKKYEFLPYISSVSFVVITLVCEDFIINLVFGEKYLDKGYIYKSFVLMWFFRLIQLKYVVIFLSKGNSKYPMYASLIRLACVPLAIVFVTSYNTVESIIFAGVFGEFAAFLYLYIKKENIYIKAFRDVA